MLEEEDSESGTSQCAESIHRQAQPASRSNVGLYVNGTYMLRFLLFAGATVAVMYWTWRHHMWDVRQFLTPTENFPYWKINWNFSTPDCPGSHGLQKFETYCRFRCNACDGHFPKGTTMYGCRACDWDLCQSCYSDGASSMSILRTPTPTKIPESSPTAEYPSLRQEFPECESQPDSAEKPAETNAMFMKRVQKAMQARANQARAAPAKPMYGEHPECLCCDACNRCDNCCLGCARQNGVCCDYCDTFSCKEFEPTRYTPPAGKHPCDCPSNCCFNCPVVCDDKPRPYLDCSNNICGEKFGCTSCCDFNKGTGCCTCWNKSCPKLSC